MQFGEDLWTLEPGTPLTLAELRQGGLYFEQQAPGSLTCGLNALNNLCQRPRFKLDDLQQAERTCAQREGTPFAQEEPLNVLQAETGAGCVANANDNAPTGLFDVEALKVAANTAGLEIVDVEPVANYRESRCFAFAESAAASQDGSWFIGFIVYDRRPGQMVHFYALRRDERYVGVWLKLDSQAIDTDQEPRNRRLTDVDLWSFYDACAPHFQAWLLRWYPVVYRAGVAREVVRVVGAADGCLVTEAQAKKVLASHGWAVSQAMEQFLEVLPREAGHELLVKLARPTEAEVRSMLESAMWQPTAALPALDEALRQRLQRASSINTNPVGARYALSLSDWDPVRAAALLALQSLRGARMEDLGKLHEALEAAGGDLERAAAVVELAPSVGTGREAAALLKEVDGSLQSALRVLQVRKRLPSVSVRVAMEALRRNDDDPHAACEMLATYEEAVQRRVLGAGQELLQGEEARIARAALDSTDWDPGRSFVAAGSLVAAVEGTRRVVRARGVSQFIPLEMVLPALTAAELRPDVAASMLVGAHAPPPMAPPRAAPAPRPPAVVDGYWPESGDAKASGSALPRMDDDACTVA